MFFNISIKPLALSSKKPVKHSIFTYWMFNRFFARLLIFSKLTEYFWVTERKVLYCYYSTLHNFINIMHHKKLSTFYLLQVYINNLQSKTFLKDHLKIVTTFSQAIFFLNFTEILLDIAATLLLRSFLFTPHVGLLRLYRNLYKLTYQQARQKMSYIFHANFFRYGFHISSNSYYICYEQTVIKSMFEDMRNYNGTGKVG